MSTTFVMSAGPSRSSAGRPRRIVRSTARQPQHPTLFHELAEWRHEQGPGGDVQHRRIWVAFGERAVAYAESHGDVTHTAVWCADEFVVHFADRLDDGPARWLTPHLHRMGVGGDVREAVLGEYADRHDGRAPATAVFPLAH